ncbi:MAG: hypothetical protein O7F74_11380 [Bacteroidetes bacterium]|nr:hypothetical protein [Bacteroidota bacterium]
MGPNDAELLRVYTREVGGTIGDISIPFNEDIEIVVEVEAGSAIFDSRAQFKVGVIVRDLSDNTIIPTAGEISGALGDEGWETESPQFTFTISSTNLGAAKENHVCEVITYSLIGIATGDASFARSPLFIITAPQGKSELISSWLLSINTENINDSRLNDVKAKLEEILLAYGAEKINISIEKGSVSIKFLAKFKRKADRSEFERDLEIAKDIVKNIIIKGIDSLEAKYIDKALLENEKIKEEIKTLKLDQIKKLIDMVLLAKSIGDIELEKQLAGTIRNGLKD